MKTIYILQGTTGEYSDRCDWIVRAYSNKEDVDKARQDVTDAFAKLWQFMETNQIHYWDYFYDCIEEKCNDEGKQLYDKVVEIDPKFIMDYTGTSWCVKECELI